MARPPRPGHPASTRSRGSKRLNTHSSASLRSHCGAQTAQFLALCVSVFGSSLHRGLPLPFVPPSASLRSLLRDSWHWKKKGKIVLLAFEFPKKPLAWTHVPGKSNAFQYLPPQRGKGFWREKERGQLVEAMGTGGSQPPGHILFNSSSHCAHGPALLTWLWHLCQQQRPGPVVSGCHLCPEPHSNQLSPHWTAFLPTAWGTCKTPVPLGVGPRISVGRAVREAPTPVLQVRGAEGVGRNQPKGPIGPGQVGAGQNPPCDICAAQTPTF